MIYISSDIIKLSNYVTPQMYGAKGDGNTDDTVAIQEALNASSLVYFPDGIYMVEAVSGGIKPNSGQTMILSNNAKLKAITNSSKTYNIVDIREVSNVHISGGKIEGENDTHIILDPENYPANSGDAGYGININASTNITIENIEIADCWGDCIMIGYAAVADEDGNYSGIQSEDINIINCKLHGGRRQGISICSGIGVVIRDCEIYDIREKSPESGIDIEPDWVGIARNILIENCYIHDTASSSIIVASNDNEKDIIKIVSCKTDGLNITNGTNILVSDSTFKNIYIANIDCVRVDNCKGNRAIICGGNAIFDGCKFVCDDENTATNLMSFGNDYIDLNQSEMVKFFNCHFITYENATHIMSYSGAAATYTYFNDKVLEFNNCLFDLGSNTGFSNRLPGDELRIFNCVFNFKKNLYQLFTINNSKTDQCNPKLIVHGSVFNCDYDDIKYLLYNTNGDPSNIEIILINNIFPKVGNMMYDNSGSAGTIRLLNNIMNTENIVGDESYTLINNNYILGQEDYNYIMQLISKLTTRVANVEANLDIEIEDENPSILNLNRTQSTDYMDENGYLNPVSFTSFTIYANQNTIENLSSSSITVTESGAGGSGVAFPFIIYDESQNIDRRGKSFKLTWNPTGTTNTRFRLMMYDGTTYNNTNLDYKDGTISSASIIISADGKTITVNNTEFTFDNILQCIAFHFSSATSTTTSYADVKLVELV